jgi:small subunit ribosomal protein S7
MRKKSAKPRILKLDPKYASLEVEKLVNHLMKGGKKSLSYQIVHSAMSRAFEILSFENQKEVKNEKEIKDEDNIFGKDRIVCELEILKKTINNLKPSIEVKMKKIGGRSNAVPSEVSHRRKNYLANKWLISEARKRKEKKGMFEKLAKEIVDAYKEKGGAYNKKIEVLKTAEANKANAHIKI